MAEADIEIEGEPLLARDVLVAGEGFVDLHAPLLLPPLGADSSGQPVSVQAVGVGELADKLLVAFPGVAWHRKVAKGTVPKGFMSRFFAAEVAACASSDRAQAIKGQTLKVWLGVVEPSGEEQLEVSDDVPSIPFQGLEALAAIWASQRSASTPLHTASAMHYLSVLQASSARSSAWLLQRPLCAQELPKPALLLSLEQKEPLPNHVRMPLLTRLSSFQVSILAWCKRHKRPLSDDAATYAAWPLVASPARASCKAPFQAFGEI